MSRADDSPTRFIDTREYVALVYRMFRTQAVREGDRRLYRLPAIQAWRKTLHYVQAVRQ